MGEDRLTMLPGQLDLFGDNCTVSSTGIVGLRLRLSSPYLCGCDIVIVGSSKGPHSAAITCDRCHKHRGWISRAEFDHIATIINNSSSRPIEPIDLTAGGASCRL